MLISSIETETEQPSPPEDFLPDDEATVAPRKPVDPKQVEAQNSLSDFFRSHPERVFFSKQLEVTFEDRYYHWITNRSLRTLAARGELKTEVRVLEGGGSIHLFWHQSYRYYRRAAASLVKSVNAYADPNVGAALGLQGEALVLDGFARHQFVMRGREVNEYGGVRWTQSGHDLDFVFERDGLAYGIEVKNTLKYMALGELRTKVELCRYLGLTPVFVCRMLPKDWISFEIGRAGGFALILKWQLYPWSHVQLARRVHRELGLPVDSPRRLQDGTMLRFVRWHQRRL